MTTDSILRRYWDSCDWISLIAEDEVARAEICERILDEAAIGECVIITSAFALAEVVKARGRVTLTVDEETAITGFFEHSYIKVHDVTRAVAEKARGIVRQHGLKPPDAVHLATALMANADVFETWNTNDFAPLVGEVPIEIREPTWEGNLELPLDYPDDSV